MGIVLKRSRQKEEGRKARGFGSLPWPLVLLAAAPLALAAAYLALEAPARVPLPAGVKVPFPAAVPVLEALCRWCGGHRLEVVLIAAALLTAGVFLPLPPSRYYLGLAVAVSLFLGFTYYTISAPVDRLIHSVEEGLPRRR